MEKIGKGTTRYCKNLSVSNKIFKKVHFFANYGESGILRFFI